MKKSLLLASCVTILLFMVIKINLHSRNDDNVVYSKRRNLPLRASDDPQGKQTAKADWNEALKVLDQKGRWYKVSSNDGEGWVYMGNVSCDKLPEENRNDLPMKSEGVTATAAGRGLTDKAEKYAKSHDLDEVAEQLQWAEKQNANITKNDAIDYLKAHNLGEYATGGAK